MATTTNYGWTTPNDTDLVKDGAAAIRTLGSSVDTTTKALNPSTTLGDIEYRSSTANTNTRLAIGTTGQVLTVAGGVPTWATSDDANAIQNAIVDAKGDLIAASAADTPARLAVGANGTVLTADSAEATGLKWAAPAGGSTFVGCAIYKTSSTTVANDTGVVVTFDSEYFDTDTFHSTSTNTGRITIPSGKDGKYLITGLVNWDANSSGTRMSRVRLNGTTVLSQIEVNNNGSSRGVGFAHSLIYSLVATDYLEVIAYQTSGGNLDVLGSGNNPTLFSVTYLGA